MIVKAESNREYFDKLGNKGKFLLIMKNEGFNVPKAYVLDSDTYDDTVRSGGIESKIQEALNILNKDNVRETSEKIGELFNTLKLPEAISKEICDLVDKDKLYAVRSSGTKEDLDEFSFAGQYQTFLNTPASEIEDKVILCYKSMFSEIILSYLINKTIDLSELKMSVVIQEMVDSEKSGICFTIDPITGNDKTMLIEVSEGLGENIVSGKTNPDRYYYNWYDKKEVDRDENNKLITHENVEKYAEVFANIQQ